MEFPEELTIPVANSLVDGFDLSVLAESDQPEVHLSHEDFRLEDSRGTMYPPLELSAKSLYMLESGDSCRVGIAFAIHNDGAPVRLHLRTRDETFTPLPTSIFEPDTGRSE